MITVIGVIVISVVIDLLALLLFWSPACMIQYYQIENELNKANYCQVDSDCKEIFLGGKYIEFGCYHFINKTVDKQYFYNKMEKYDSKCTGLIDMCFFAPKPKCVSDKCVSVEK
ncbi:MAG TPA: hypothetical protein VMW41_05440 [Candidatus Bathyarchaeia archaeon]|nr:hypothetical protein [Candidatus Bathyarchaeia archaeon]